MHRWWSAADISVALRWLGAPLTVLCLAVMALNDHVLKQAWPGLVTGKLSDITGLVVAPPLLAVALTLCRIPRPAVAALVATALGFVLTKSTQAGSDVASAVWSQFGFPTYIRRDPTDLIALPALIVADRVRMRAHRSAELLRRRAQLAVGAVLLPFAVLATAATSCDRGDGVGALTVVAGDFAGAPHARQRMLVVDTDGPWIAIGPAGEIRELATGDVNRIEFVPRWASRRCDPANRLACWRAGTGDRPSVESTSDGGQTWHLDYEMRQREFEQLLAELGEGCGGPRFGVGDLAVLGTPRGPIVASAAGHAGLLLRLPGEPWKRISPAELESLAAPPSPGKPRGPLSVQDPLTRFDDESDTPDEPGTPVDPPPPCPSPNTVTLTPDPRNGHPFVARRCADGSYSGADNPSPASPSPSRATPTTPP